MRHFYSVFVFGLLGSVAAPAQTAVPLNAVPSRIVGHPQPEGLNLSTLSPNLVEGREFLAPQGIAIDTSVTPPILYVSDTGNNRILAWRNAASFRNGQPADLVIGQTDFFRTGAFGPNTTFSTGLTSPTGLTVYNGDLYVADTGNNRIMRFRKPFNNVGNQFPDLHIGQPGFTRDTANYLGKPDRQGLNLANNTTYMVFDGSGNLWVTDPGNRRVLQFLAAEVAAGGGPLRANLEIGQLDFDTVQPAVTSANPTKPDAFAVPSHITFDAAGRLYVTDSGGAANAVPTVSRVLVFNPPFTNGMAANRIMGIPTAPATQDAFDKTAMFGPEGIFFLPAAGKMGVVDSFSNRILLFDNYEKWPDPVTMTSPLATGVVGQPDFRGRNPNGNPANYITLASASGLRRPTAVALAGSELFVADTFNNRVVVLPLTGDTFGAATRVLGQDFFYAHSPNLIEGREFQFIANSADAGIAIDYSSETPHLYVADTYNHRILGFNDMRKVQAGVKADIVIGQADFTTGICNFRGLNDPDTGNPDRPSQSSLCSPTGLLLDAGGNLYVADSGNSRVLRFPSPFAYQGSLPQADLVLGQRTFTTRITDPSTSTMSVPYGLAFAGNSGLVVSDQGHNRVLYIPFSSGGTFNAPADNGKAATKVFGQSSFVSTASGNSDNSLNGPHHIATDGEAHLYVADTGNNRVVIFDQVTTNATPPTGAPAVKVLPGFTNIRGVFVNPSNGELWVGEGNSNGQVRKYPRLAVLINNSASTGMVLSPTSVLALAQDNFGNLALADQSSRVSFYFPGLQTINAANYNPARQLAPATFASICSPGTNCLNGVAEFGSITTDFNSLPNPLPFPKSLGDIQVLVNGTPAALTYVSPQQINFIVPWSAPTSGTADVVVVQPSTGRVYAAGVANMNTYAPGIFAAAPVRVPNTIVPVQAAVINADGTVNTTTSCAVRGSYISIYATGHGLVPNPPADGALPQGLVETPFQPRIVLNTGFTDEMTLEPSEPTKMIQFSGLSPIYPGVWQINAYIPKVVGPGQQVPIAIIAGSVPGNDPQVTGYRTVICVAP